MSSQGWSQVRRVWRKLNCCHIVLCLEIRDQNRLVCWSIVVKEKASVYSPFLVAFPSGHIPKATKYVLLYRVYTKEWCNFKS